ncbi:MAG: hypothetical protein AB1894_16620 [Chloroflexota bacterium]
MIVNLRTRWALDKFRSWRNQLRIRKLARQVASHSRPSSEAKLPPAEQEVPGEALVFFIASARLGGLSQNAAFSFFASAGLRLAGVPVHFFVCQAGMSPCVLGTNRQGYTTPPPCKACIRQSRSIYAGASENVHWFKYHPDAALASALKALSVPELTAFEYKASEAAALEKPVPLGKLVLPAIRWALRLHTLPDDEDTRYLLRQYILSAYNVAVEFAALLEQLKLSTAVIFNGIMYPEAAARWVAQQRGLRVITHEVGFQRYSAFFSDGDATAYPIPIPADFELTPEQNARLDAYLEKRFQGNFSMAGIRFWPEMRGLDEAFLQKAGQFRPELPSEAVPQIVPIFTNVVYDTSQVHANQVFPHMFAWLETVLQVIRAHPETLFVIRAHPDEMRPGTAKLSRESVRDWVAHNAVDKLPNVIFIDSQEYLSSYELIQRSKFVIVYNSSIGLEAALMGKPVVCGGKARYTQYPIVVFPDSPQAYAEQLAAFLEAKTIEVPPEFQQNARRFLYFQLYRASLSFSDYLEEGHRKGYVQLRDFTWQALLPENSPAIRTILSGISRTPSAPFSETTAFLLPESQVQETNEL